MTDALALLKGYGQAVNAYFERILAWEEQSPARLIEAMGYSLRAGGKRLRPALVLETARACGAGREQSINASALAAAAAIELIHTFSLIHDDLPAMDNDDLRRGKPTNHKVFGEAMASLAGDALESLAFDVLAQDAEPALAVGLIAELAGATGPQGMIGGQVLDMEGENKSLSLDQLQRLHRMKTGALLCAACRLGAISASADQTTLERLSQFGRHLGLAFQIVDDLLDVTSTPEQLGKATGKDQAKGKNTYPSLLGLEGSRREADAALAAAIQALEPLGASAQGLVLLARFVVERQI
jgi:geranylgeranyl pyrophosphate synthase